MAHKGRVATLVSPFGTYLSDLIDLIAIRMENLITLLELDILME